jgi:hypothetical protein
MSRDDRSREILHDLRRIERTEDEILYLLRHRLSSIRIRFSGGNMANTDPLTLTVGQTAVATVVGFDQNGQPFTGPIPAPSWSIDNPTFDSIAADGINPAAEDITSLAVGVANLTATVQGPAGPLTDTEAITNVQPQVLTSIQIQFAALQAAAAAAAKKA